uniref:Beta-Casp domain-containing protein n=1 Tax=Globodera rostochiensis TaxID=31243 RepID=A0A914HXU0_GLORO
MSIELKSVSWTATRSCILVKFPNLQILLDCAVVRSNRMSWQKKVHPYGKGVIPILKQMQELVYAELLPEVRTVQSRDLDLSDVDAILVSNTVSLVALPFYTEGTGFKGTVYATDPTVQLGKLVMEDLCDMFERVDRPVEDTAWAWKALCQSFSNAPLSDPNEWRPFYTRETMEKSLARIRRVFFREEIVINGELYVSAFSSGYAIGSSNWLLKTEQHRFGYLAPSSLRHSHSKPMELAAFAELDSLLLTSQSTIDQAPDLNVFKFSSAVIETLKMGGNVLIPVTPTGLVYDMFECVLKTIELQNLSRNIPIYFISTVAESSLQFAQIYPEWLSDDKGSRVYKPEEPFFHSELARTGRIRVYDSLHGPFSRDCRQPCVVFAGHPSLRIGEIVQLLDLWGGMSRNAIIMIDPDYPLETYYAPYKSLAIRAYYYPIETRLDGTQVLNKVRFFKFNLVERNSFCWYCISLSFLSLPI